MSALATEKNPSPPVAVNWLYGPWLDVIVGCGAWSAPLLLLSYSATASHARGWSLAFYALALFFNYPHYMATIYRAYHRAEDFQKYRIFTVHITAVLLLTVFISHFWIAILPWIFTLYLTWSPWHYTGQNYGVFMMFARRAGAGLSQSARHALYGAFIASYLVLFLSFHTGPSSDPLFISLGIPARVAHMAEVGLATAFVVLSAYGLLPLLRQVGWRKLSPCFTLYSSQILWFLFPVGLTLIRGLEIPQNRYSSGVLAVMHSAQYIWITSYYARREAKDASGGSWRFSGYFAVLVAGGIALFIPGPWLASRVFHHDFTSSFLIFTALVNLHHFILDGAIWKLRDGRVASLLLNSRNHVTNAAAEAQGWVSSSWAWISGGSTLARSMRISAALLLLVFGILDQTRYYFALHADDLRDLQRAEWLNSSDGPTQMHLAQRELETGHAEQAEAAWRKAIRSNPADMEPRQELLRFLLQQSRFDEAYGLIRESLNYSPRDANLWVDRGLLASRRGDSSQAIESWNRALALDPHQTLAHFYLANELDRSGQPLAAAGHYKIVLNAIAQQAPANRPPAEKVIAIVLRMADCQDRAAQTEQAQQAYGLAATVAAQTHETKLESIAKVNMAELQAKTGNVAQALRLFQDALRLDDFSGDRAASAEDWLAYARFLENAGFPDRAVYACLVKAVSFQNSLPEPSQKSYLAEITGQTANRLGKVAGAIRRDPEPTLREALTLQAR